MSTEFTTNYGMELPDFRTATWHDAWYNNFRTVDTLLKLGTGLPSVKGSWVNSTLYEVDDRVLDPVDGSLWVNQVEHTSAASGLMSAERAANPTYWENVGNGWTARGEWQQSTAYVVGDTAYDESEYLYAVCETAHTSAASGTLRDDIANWVILMDGMATVTDAVAAKTAAETAETNAETAETNAETAATNAGNSETAAAISETNAGISETNAGISETNAGNSATTATNAANAASDSADAAAISETNAGNSATAAATSETNAGISETNAAATLANVVQKAGDTMTGQLILPASVIGEAPLNIPDGVDPTASVDGDIWRRDAGGGLFIRKGANTVKVIDGQQTMKSSRAWLTDTKAQNAAAQALSSGNWVKRQINTENYDPDALVTVASDEFTLAAGSDYLVRAVSAYFVAGSSASASSLRFYDVTSAAVVQSKATAANSNSNGVAGILTTEAVLVGGRTYRVEHHTNGSVNAGVPANLAGMSEVYLSVAIERITNVFA